MEFAESINHRINVGLFVLLKGVKVVCDLVKGEKKPFCSSGFKNAYPPLLLSSFKNRIAKGQTCAFFASETIM